MVVTLFSSCVNDLDQAPLSSITDASFWQTEDDAMAAVIGMHGVLRTTMDFEYFQWADMRGEYYNYGFEVTHGNSYQFYFENRLDEENAGVQYETIYKAISEANAILHFVPGISFNDDEEKQQVLGMAYGFRAYCYFLLARTWGDVPVVDAHIAGYDDVTALQIPRTPVAQVYELIDSDLTEALTLMGESNVITDKYIISRPAVLAIKAEVALTKASLLGLDKVANAQVALDCVNEVLGSSDVSFNPSYADIFNTSDKKNSEIVWAMAYFLDEGMTTKPLPSRMYVSPEKWGEIGDQVNKEEVLITFESAGFSNDVDAQTGNSYNAWDGGTTIGGAWVGPGEAGACGWDNDGGGNSLAGNTLDSPYDNVGDGYMRVSAQKKVLVKLPDHIEDINYIGCLAKLAGSSGDFTEEEKTLSFEASLDEGANWFPLGDIVINANYGAKTSLWESEFPEPLVKQDKPIWVRFSTGGVKIHIFDNLRFLSSKTAAPVYDPNGVNPGNNSVSFNYATYKAEICQRFVDAGDPRAESTFKLVYDTDGSDLGGIAYKYRGEFEESTGNRHYISDVILYRAGELALMAAEAHVLKGEYAEAIGVITQLRGRVGLSTTITADAESVTAALVDEYMFETMGEGKRWFQMLRFGGSATVKYILEATAPGMYFYENMPVYSPLSRSIMTRNPELDQTTGYPY